MDLVEASRKAGDGLIPGSNMLEEKNETHGRCSSKLKEKTRDMEMRQHAGKENERHWRRKLSLSVLVRSLVSRSRSVSVSRSSGSSKSSNSSAVVGR